MFEDLSDVRQPAITRKSVDRILVVVFLLGLALGARLTSLTYPAYWKTRNPLHEVIFWFVVLTACGAVWRFIPAILDKLSPRGNSSGKSVL
jgi:hypothetical protein